MNKLLFALALFVCAPAFAVSSSASLTSQGYVLTDLNPNDGVAASISFGTTQWTPRTNGASASFASGVGSVWGSSGGTLYAAVLDVVSPFTLSANTAVTFNYQFHSVQSFASGLAPGTVLEPASFATLFTPTSVASTGYVSQFNFDKVLTVAYSNSTGAAFTGTVDYRLGTTNESPVFTRDHREPPTVAPIPEPETYAMMLAGLMAMTFVARRVRAKRPSPREQ